MHQEFLPLSPIVPRATLGVHHTLGGVLPGMHTTINRHLGEWVRHHVPLFWAMECAHAMALGSMSTKTALEMAHGPRKDTVS